MRGMRGHIWWRTLMVLVLLTLAAAGGALWHDYRDFVHTPLPVGSAAQELDIARGTSFQHIVRTLRARGLTQAPAWYWRVLARRMGVIDSLDAGQYAITAGTTPPVLLRQLAEGKVIQYRFTLVDGWDFRQLRAALAQAPYLVHDSAKLSGAQIMRRIGAKGEAAEGWFLPETYAYVKGDTDLSLLRRAHAAMVKVLDRQWQERADDVAVKSPYQALILASLVEKETAQPAERARIAGVFTRRLERGMRLQTDPTVIYGMGAAYHGDITWKALRTDTPYNTYLHAGLPPTPIAMPGQAAIHAALHPAAGKALYFVARGDGSGRHVFSRTLAQHNRAVACHQLKRRCPR